MKRKSLSIIVLSPIIITLIACSTVSNIRSIYEDSKETIQGAATLASGVATQHPGLLETAGSFAAEQGPRLASTAEAFATQNPGILETANSFASEQGPRLGGTAEAFATQNPGILETAQALVQEQGAALLGTAQVMATKNPELLETAKAMIPRAENAIQLTDIPVPSLYPLEILYNSTEALSYSVEASFNEILDFYKTEMHANGWNLDIEGSYEGQNMSSLKYMRPNRYASVTISSSSALDRTLVVIYTENQ